MTAPETFPGHLPVTTRRRWLAGASLAVSMLAIGWVAWTFAGQLGEVRARVADGPLIAGMLVGAPAYAALTLLLTLAWWWLLGIYERRPTLRAAYAIWARSQIAKYLPGNVLHYASRQVLGRRLGIGHANLVASAVMETGSTLLAAATISIHAALPAARDGASLPAPWMLVAVPLGAVLAWPVIDRLLRRSASTARHLRALPVLSLRRALRLLVPSLALHGAFLFGTGALLLGLLWAGWPALEISAPRVIGSYALAWLAGTLMPGAPGGLGVREAVLTLLLAPRLGAAHASALALALRGVTLGGDLLTTLGGWAASRTARS